MIRMILIISALIAGLMLGPEISNNKGYILISFDSYTTYEMTIINAILIAIIFYFLLLLAEWILRRLLSMSSVTRGWLGQRKTKKAQKNSQLGMWALYEGKNKQAHKLLSNSAERSGTPALTYIAAAKAAHLQGLYDQRDKHLVLAGESQKGAQLSVGLIWVELQIDAKQYENALATLKELDSKFPNSQLTAMFYLDIYPTLNEWKKYIRVLNEQRKKLDYNSIEFEAIQLNAHQHLFKQLATDDVESFKIYWDSKAPRWMRKELNYQKAALDAYIESDNGGFARELLMEKLNKQFSLPLLPYLDKVAITDYSPFINLLEKKLKRGGDSGLLNQALAKLKLKESNPEDAIKHLELSVESNANAEDYSLLARLLEENGRADEAGQYYRLGLLSATQSSTEVVTI